MGPVVYKTWEILQSKISRIESAPIKKRVGNQTVVFNVDYLKYDPKIPILKADDIERWLARPREPHVEPVPPPAPLRPPPPPPPPDELEVSVREVQTEDSEPTFETIEDTVDDFENGNGFETSSSQSDSIGEAVCEGELDKLVITEEHEDEYRYLEDEEDTEYFKCKKRIRPDPPQPQKPPQTTTQARPQQNTTQPPRNQNQQVLANNSGLTQKRNEMTNGTTNGFSTNNHQTRPSMSVPAAPAAPEASKAPVEPDWPELAKKVEQNLLISVYKELSHFKDKVNLSKEGKMILKSAILKCIMEDETNVLIDSLNLLFELNFEEDTVFWIEVLKRINRKISSHAQVRKFKVKTNPDWVFASYQRAMVIIFGYAKKYNKSLVGENLSLTVLISMIDPFNEHELLTTNPDKQRMNQEAIDRKIQIKKEIKREKQENMDPGALDSRRVEEITTPDGAQSFKITIPNRGRPTKTTQRLRL